MNLLKTLKRSIREENVPTLIPLLLARDQAMAYVGRPKIFKDMLKAGWIEPVVNEHKLQTYKRKDLEEAVARLCVGCYPHAPED